MTKSPVKAYYDKIAKDYDSSRFDNSYGKFIDKQERLFLDQTLTIDNTLNLGCGTGRFMEYCDVGFDISQEMINEAAVKFPNKEYHRGTATKTPFRDNQFEAVICFHVIMHLDKITTEEIFKEVYRILKPNGLFIFDYPSAERRKLTRDKQSNWHGANSYSKREISEVINRNNFLNEHKKGVLFTPIHRIPKKIRNAFYKLDQLLTKSPWKQYSSYLIHAVKKKNHDS
jgi:ubiquinone/menaquinone biosynthesis C-methylase UbiE